MKTARQEHGEAYIAWCFYVHAEQFADQWVTVGQVSAWANVSKPTAKKWLGELGVHIIESEKAIIRGKNGTRYRMTKDAIKHCVLMDTNWARLARRGYKIYRDYINPKTRGIFDTTKD